MSAITEGCRAAWRRWYAPIEELSDNGPVSLSSGSLRDERQRAFVAGFEGALAATLAVADDLMVQSLRSQNPPAVSNFVAGIRAAVDMVRDDALGKREPGGEPT